MKLPWVSRDRADGYERLWAEAIVRESKWMDRYEALLCKYDALRVSGAVVPMQVQPREIDVVAQAVIAKSKGNPVLYQHYGSFVATQRAMGVEEQQIANEILHGVQDDQGVPL